MTALIVAELRQRVRGRRWWVVLVLWTLVLVLLLLLVRSAARQAIQFGATPPGFVGTAMFAALALLVLALASLVVPALTSTAINGERDRGTLAVLQSTPLRPWEIALAKFVAAWVSAGVFLLATVPLAVWAAIEGGVGFARAVVVYLVLAVLSAVLVAIGLAASSVVVRPVLSTVTAYAVVFFMTALLPVFFGLALATAPRNIEFGPEVGWRWVLLAGDPFVVLADAAPRSPDEGLPDPLAAIREAVRYARDPRPFGDASDAAALWPTGLGINLALGAGAIGLAVSRLKVPARRLPRGQRVA